MKLKWKILGPLSVIAACGLLLLNLTLGIVLLLVILISARLYRLIKPFDEEPVEEEKHLDDEEYIDVHAEVKEIRTDEESL